MNTISFKNVFVKEAAAVCGPIEAQGPLKEFFDKTHDDIYCLEDNYEAAERKLLKDAVEEVLKKAKLTQEEVDVAIGGDLLNQLATSHYFMKSLPVPFLGVYGACSTSVLSAINASIFVEHGYAKHALAFTSSHNATAERQFRYPNEYGVQKPPTTTFTATGAGAFLFSSKKSSIQLTQATLGKVVDFDFSNANDMGSAMAPAALDTIMTHFKNTNTDFKDYDLIVTGDLSKIGNEILIDLFRHKNMDHLGKLVDCGCILYDLDKQQVFAGGSGCACSALVTIAWIFEKLKKKELHKVMVVATGALLSVTLSQQKQSIPCIAHAVVYESAVEE